MATQQLKVERNRIESDMDAWKRVEDKLVQRYGKKIMYDRDFIKARRDIYKHIHDKHRKKPLNLYEKAELRVLLSQNRSMLRQLYPNPAVRLLRNVLVFAGNLVKGSFKVLLRAGKAFMNPPVMQRPPTAVNTRADSTFKQTTPQQAQQQLTSQQRTIGQKRAVQNNSIVRKLPTKVRVQMPPVQNKGLRH